MMFTIPITLSLATLIFAMPKPDDNPIAQTVTAGCWYDSSNNYVIVIPNDGSDSGAGYDAQGNCGLGFLDNIRGNGLDPQEWNCMYSSSSDTQNGACATFSIDDDNDPGAVEQAFQQASGVSYGPDITVQCVANPDLACPAGF
jgi:hypothetical protein